MDSNEEDDGLKLAKEIVRKRIYAEKRFENVFQGIKVLSGGKGNIVCEFLVKPEHRNTHGTLHGGLMSTLVDSVTTWAFHTLVTDKNSMSIDLHLSFMRPAPVGQSVIVDARTVKSGRRVAFLTADIKSPDGTLYARGSHIKLVIENSKL